MRRTGEPPESCRSATDLVARLQQLIALSGAGTREALWAVQLIERKAAVARWRSGAIGRGDARLPRSGEVKRA